MDEQKEKQNAKKKRSALPIYAIGAVWLLYAKKLDSFRGILSCAVVSLIVYAILRIVMRGKKSEEPPKTAAPEQPQPKQEEKKPEPQPQSESDREASAGTAIGHLSGQARHCRYPPSERRDS